MSVTTYSPWLRPIEFGVFLPPTYQWLDATGAVDYINAHSRGYLEWIGSFAPVPEEIIKEAPVINWHWIAAAGDLKPINASSGPPTTPTHTFETAPQLDYIIVPGPDPEMPMSAEAIAWLKGQFPELKALLTICSSSLYLTQTGLLDGVQAATNKFNLRTLVEAGKFHKFNKVKWVPDARFVVDGKVWSSAGVTSGLDLAAEFTKAHFDARIVELVRNAFEYKANSARPDPFAFLLEGVPLE